VALICSALFFCIQAYDFLLSKGFQAYDEKDFARANALLTPVAFLGNHGAQTILGSMYAIGSVPQDGEKAVYWLERAASGGTTQAQMMLGALYLTGVVVARDTDKAQLWIERAAEGGDIEAKRLLRSFQPKRGQI